MDILDQSQVIATYLKKSGDLDLYEKSLNLRAEILRLREENLYLQEQLKASKRASEVRSNIVWDSPYYWMKEGDQRDGPFCQVCYDAQKSLIRLQGRRGAWTCLACKNSVRDSSWSPPTAPEVRRNQWG